MEKKKEEERRRLIIYSRVLTLALRAVGEVACKNRKYDSACEVGKGFDTHHTPIAKAKSRMLKVIAW